MLLTFQSLSDLCLAFHSKINETLSTINIDSPSRVKYLEIHLGPEFYFLNYGFFFKDEVFKFVLEDTVKDRTKLFNRKLWLGPGLPMNAVPWSHLLAILLNPSEYLELHKTCLCLAISE